MVIRWRGGGGGSSHGQVVTLQKPLLYETSGYTTPALSPCTAFMMSSEMCPCLYSHWQSLAYVVCINRYIDVCLILILLLPGNPQSCSTSLCSEGLCGERIRTVWTNCWGPAALQMFPSGGHALCSSWDVFLPSLPFLRKQFTSMQDNRTSG